MIHFLCCLHIPIYVLDYLIYFVLLPLCQEYKYLQDKVDSANSVLLLTDNDKWLQISTHI